MGPQSKRAWQVLAVVTALGAGLRLWLCWNDDGLFWPDEIFQTLEPAHRLVYGYGLVAWEFIEGARNWAMPAVVAALLEVARPFTDSPTTYLHWVRAVFALVGVGTALGVYRLARVLKAGPLHACAGAALFALGAPFIYFAPRAMSETASALCVVFGFALALEEGRPRGRQVAGACLLGVAVLLRLQNALFCAGLLGILAGRRQGRALRDAAVALAAFALAFGLLDKLTWGDWFHSAFVYWRFNFIEGKAAQWGTAPWTFYGRVFWTSLGPVDALLLAFAALAFFKARGTLLTALLFVALHSATGHKEIRFLLPVAPVFCALAGVGLSWVAEREPTAGRLGLWAVLALSGWSALRFGELTFGELGQYEDSRPGASAYDDSGPVDRLLLIAHGVPDLCGLKVEAVHLAWTGGYSYLHRDVPLYPHTGPPRESGLFNYVITRTGWAPPGSVVASDHDLALARTGSACAPDPGYSWRLP